MRALALPALVLLSGCQLLLGIEDPVAGMVGADGDACSDVFDDSCPENQTCDWYSGAETGTCRRASSALALAPCASAVDCGLDQHCEAGACRTYCELETDCTGVEDDCHVETPIGKYCDTRCDVTATDDGGCGPGRECLLWNLDTEFASMCTPAGYGGDVTPLGACVYLEECGPGYICYGAVDNAHCRRGCIPGVEPSPCTDGTTCVALSNDLHGSPVGVCVPGAR